MKRFLLVLLFLSAGCLGAFSQTPAPTPEEDRDVVKITTNLIQLDVTVTDSSGRIVTDLKPEEIEIYENKKKQEITNFSFINAESKTVERQLVGKAAPKNKPLMIPQPPLKLRPEQVRRTLALVVDDIGLSFESMNAVIKTLRKFVDEQMQPNDLVAIVRTASGVGASQQFTSDKRQLLAVINRIKWYPGGKAGVTAFAAIAPGISKNIRPPSMIGKQPDEDVKEAEDERQNRFQLGTISGINYILKGMRRIPGRKSLVLFSDGFGFQRDGGVNSDVVTSLRELADLANRSAVIISTLDARGLQPLGLTAEDSVGEMSIQEVQSNLRARSTELFVTQGSLDFLAKVTGGVSIKNRNDLTLGLERILYNQASYYLVGYQPDEKTFDPAKLRFNWIDVKVNRPGVRVSFRSGFINRRDTNNEGFAAKPFTPKAQIFEALLSPFSAGEITVNLTPIFTDTERQGSYLSSLIHVKASDLKFTDEPDGWKKSVFNIVVAAMGADGTVVDSVSREQVMRVKGPTYERLMRDGFVYTIPFPVKKPGPYQMRVALRDGATAKIGSANQFVDVPDLSKERVTVGGIILQNVDDKQQNTGDGMPDLSQTDYIQNTALRQFRSDSALFYNTTFYGAKPDAGKRPQLKTQVKIYRDGKEIFAEPETDYIPAAGDDIKRLPFRGAVRFANGLPPGQYILQIIVSDLLAKEKYRIQNAWTDFEIVQ
ncbi:MAG TPA: VWA domain-containing protein [Pyrinomonadaceae bacterium]|jgi:VWFA-related protein|nr:VWA domain-containing protein [Pyrinomonadaceae bacterium]